MTSNHRLHLSRFWFVSVACWIASFAPMSAQFNGSIVPFDIDQDGTNDLEWVQAITLPSNPGAPTTEAISLRPLGSTLILAVGSPSAPASYTAFATNTAAWNGIPGPGQHLTDQPARLVENANFNIPPYSGGPLSSGSFYGTNLSQAGGHALLVRLGSDATSRPAWIGIALNPSGFWVGLDGKTYPAAINAHVTGFAAGARTGTAVTVGIDSAYRPLRMELAGEQPTLVRHPLAVGLAIETSTDPVRGPWTYSGFGNGIGTTDPKLFVRIR